MTAPIILTQVSGLRDLTGRYEVLLCDIWGVVHDGVKGFEDAIDALRNFRRQGGVVVLITNAPRPAASVRDQVAGLNIPGDIEDAIVTSGDVTRSLIESHPARKVFHLGPARDQPLIDGLDITLTDFDGCELILCSGLYDDDNDTPEDYRELLTAAAGRKLEMICANPDHVVHRGSKRVYCAGALAALYEQLGGPAVYAGKPHRPIYDLALAAASAPGKPVVAESRVLAIGDNLATDIAGAARFGLDALFIAGGIHADDVKTQDDAQTIAIEAGDEVFNQHLIGYQAALCW